LRRLNLLGESEYCFCCLRCRHFAPRGLILETTEICRNRTFVYGPEHQRTKQTRSDSTTIIYAGAQEVETKTGVGTTVKTYWPYGVGVEIDRPTTGLEMNWVHVDRLGRGVGFAKHCFAHAES
jgi:hypothetical protein